MSEEKLPLSDFDKEKYTLNEALNTKTIVDEIESEILKTFTEDLIRVIGDEPKKQLSLFKRLFKNGRKQIFSYN